MVLHFSSIDDDRPTESPDEIPEGTIPQVQKICGEHGNNTVVHLDEEEKRRVGVRRTPRHI